MDMHLEVFTVDSFVCHNVVSLGDQTILPFSTVIIAQNEQRCAPYAEYTPFLLNLSKHHNGFFKSLVLVFLSVMSWGLMRNLEGFHVLKGGMILHDLHPIIK